MGNHQYHCLFLYSNYVKNNYMNFFEDFMGSLKSNYSFFEGILGDEEKSI